MTTQETELPDSQERGGLKRKPTGPPRLLLGKTKSKEKCEGKSQRRQREAKSTVEGNDQENKEEKSNLSSPNSKNSSQDASEDREAQLESPEEIQGVYLNLEDNENKIKKQTVSRSTSKTSIKRTFSSLLMCRKQEESGSTENETMNLNEAKKTSNLKQVLGDVNNKMVPNKKSKKRFTFWFIKKSVRTSNATLEKEDKDQPDHLNFQEIAEPKGETFKKFHHIFQKRKKPASFDQFNSSALNALQNEGNAQNDQTDSVVEITSKKNEENQRENQDIKAQSYPEILTISAEVSFNTNVELNHSVEENNPSDQDVSLDKEETQDLQTSCLLKFEVLPSGCSSNNAPGSQNASKRESEVFHEQPLDKNGVKCRPVITIEHAPSSDEESVNDGTQFDGLGINGSWQYLKLNNLTNNRLHPSDLNKSSEVDPSQFNESVLIQTAISMVEAAICGAVEQLKTEQRSLEHA